jgi:DNA repair protein RecN (Recombination protein N)
VQEIHAARLKPGEQEELESERRRLANAEQLAELSSEAVQLLQEGASAPMGEGAAQGGALDALGAAEHALARLARVDPQVGRFREQLAEAIALLDDLARELGRYRDEIEFNPRRLQQVEERLHLIHSLQRKYGDSIADVLAYAERAAAELETITHAEERIADLEAEETQLLTEIGAAGVALSAARRAAGERMARAIEIELDDLQMQGAAFGVQIAWTADPTGAFVAPGDATAVGEPEGRYAFHADGLDHVIFLVSANPGEPLRPLAKVASGGETSRLMLALKTVLGRADETPTLIFDEIDQGIGGRVGATVGKKLRGLARGQPVLAKPGGTGGRGQETGDRRQGSGGSVSWPVVQERLAEPGSAEGQPSAANNRPSHQVLCITHLPQLAAHGDVHFHVAKRVTGGRTLTGVQKLDGESRVAELARMMGTDTDAGRLSVLEMMHEVSN